MKLRDKLMIAGVAVFTALVIGLLTFVIVRHETGGTDEPGLLSVCWRSDGQADFNTSRCTSPEEITWPVTSIPLVVHSSSPEQQEQLSSVIADMNDQIGCEVMANDNLAESQYNILVMANVPMTAGSGDHPGGATSFRRDTLRRQRAFVDIFAAPHSGVGDKVLMHELGHALGLAHDSWHGSIMRPSQSGQVEIVRISDNDRRLLRELYCTPPG